MTVSNTCIQFFPSSFRPTAESGCQYAREPAASTSVCRVSRMSSSKPIASKLGAIHFSHSKRVLSELRSAKNETVSETIAKNTSSPSNSRNLRYDSRHESADSRPNVPCIAAMSTTTNASCAIRLTGTTALANALLGRFEVDGAIE